MNNNAANHRRYPFYIFKMAQGMVASAWFPLLARTHYAVSPRRIPFALYVSVNSIVNSTLAVVQRLIFSRRIADTEIGAPLFVIGHWRTGTTWLHELFALDDRFIAPNTLQCFTPSQCLVVGWLLRIFAALLPEKRPMDNVAFGWDRPQEDEFALLNLGLGSPYETILFPNRRPIGYEFLDLSEISAVQLAAWKSGLTYFFKLVVFSAGRQRKNAAAGHRLVAKSPPHTARIDILRQLFPNAQFVHVVRHPYDIFASTVHLWRTLYDTQGFQIPQFGELPGSGPSLDDYVLDTMDRLYRNFPMQALRPERFYQVRYEDLRRDPIGEMRKTYAQLQLGAFDTVGPKIQAYLDSNLETYRSNNHQISAAQKAAIDRRWQWYFAKYGYSPQSEGAQADTN